MNGERTTVLVRLDQPADDYAIRFYSYSKVQAIQGYSILRYPVRRTASLYGYFHLTKFLAQTVRPDHLSRHSST
jgi:hypothetical protein